MGADKVSPESVTYAINQLRNTKLSEALRATCAVFIGKFGSATGRRILRTHYSARTDHHM